MIRLILFTIIAFLFLGNLTGCENSISDKYNQAEQNADGYNLNNDYSELNIPKSAKTIKLTRGTYTYTLTKKENLNKKRYMVYVVDTVRYTSKHKPSPDDRYSRNIDIFPADDKSAVRGFKDFETGSWEIKTDADMKKARQMIADTKQLNRVKFSIGILPADSIVSRDSKKIKNGDIIVVSGIRFKHAKIINNGKEETVSMCLADRDVFYLTDLEIVKD